MKLQYLEVHLGDELPKLGSGFRPVLVWTGRKKATLFSPFNMQHVTIPLEAKRAWNGVVVHHGMDSLRATPLPLFPQRLLKIITQNIIDRQRWGIFDGGNTALKAVDLLRAADAANDNETAATSRKVPKAA